MDHLHVPGRAGAGAELQVEEDSAGLGDGDVDLRAAPGTTDGPLRPVPHPLPVCELCADPEFVPGAVPVTARQGEFLQVDPA